MCVLWPSIISSTVWWCRLFKFNKIIIIEFYAVVCALLALVWSYIRKKSFVQPQLIITIWWGVWYLHTEFTIIIVVYLWISVEYIYLSNRSIFMNRQEMVFFSERKIIIFHVEKTIFYAFPTLNWRTSKCLWVKNTTLKLW